MAIRCVSRYSESRIRREGSTIEVRDLLERLPLEWDVSWDFGLERVRGGGTLVFFGGCLGSS